jgi:hypothetical protein
MSIFFRHGSIYSYIIWRMINRHVGGHSSETVSHPINTNNNIHKWTWMCHERTHPNGNNEWWSWTPTAEYP